MKINERIIALRPIQICDSEMKERFNLYPTRVRRRNIFYFFFLKFLLFITRSKYASHSIQLRHCEKKNVQIHDEHICNCPLVLYVNYTFKVLKYRDSERASNIYHDIS